MRALQALQPQLQEIKEKYKNDKQRMQQEMMRFYKDNKVNPFASCVPLVANFQSSSPFSISSGTTCETTSAVRPRRPAANSPSARATPPGSSAKGSSSSPT